MVTLKNNTSPMQLYTTEEAAFCLTALHKIQNEAFLKKKHTFEQMFDALLPHTLSMQLQMVLQQTDFSKKSFDKQREYFNTIETMIQELPVVSLTLAFSPTRDCIREWWENITTQLKHGVILDISYDATLIGGAAITYHGKYYEDTIRKKLQLFYKNENGL